jgi:hypothetical protein
MKKNNKTLPTVAMVTVAMAALLASAAITPYSNDVSAKKYGDSNAQTSAAINDCPAELISLIIGIQQQASANCLNDINSIQDSDGAAISSAPTNAAPNQKIDIELEFGDEFDGSGLLELGDVLGDINLPADLSTYPPNLPTN